MLFRLCSQPDHNFHLLFSLFYLFLMRFMVCIFFFSTVGCVQVSVASAHLFSGYKIKNALDCFWATKEWIKSTQSQAPITKQCPLQSLTSCIWAVSTLLKTENHLSGVLLCDPNLMGWQRIVFRGEFKLLHKATTSCVIYKEMSLFLALRQYPVFMYAICE